jgi:inosine triphosphate pyrophosphatase
MEPLCLITSNVHKLTEARLILPALEGWAIDLPEIQHAEPRPVIEAKLLAALNLGSTHARLLVEDTGLYLDALQGLPGPLIKWFLAPGKLGLEGLYQLAHRQGQTTARAITVIGYLERHAEGITLRYFEGVTAGQIVAPRGQQGFGWDSIFCPEGSPHTFAEMEPAEKLRFSMRRQAFARLRACLDSSR